MSAAMDRAVEIVARNLFDEGLGGQRDSLLAEVRKAIDDAGLVPQPANPAQVTELPDDDAPKDWRDLAEAAIMDLRRYAYDETHHRRIVSAEAYEDRFNLLAAIGAGGQAVADKQPYPLANQLQAGLDKLRAAASRGALSSREVFTLTDPLMDLIFRAAQEDHSRSALSQPHPADGRVVEALHGPFGWLNGCRGLSEDNWNLESDPLENSDEYFSVPLYAMVDPFKEGRS